MDGFDSMMVDKISREEMMTRLVSGSTLWQVVVLCFALLKLWWVQLRAESAKRRVNSKAKSE